MGICIVSTCFYFWAIVNNSVLNIYIQVFVWTYIFSSLGYVCLEVELQGHLVTLCLTSWETAELFSRVAALFILPAAKYECSNFYTSSATLTVVCLFYYNHLVIMKWHIVVLICISIMTKDIEHCFMNLLVICICSLKKCLFKFFVHLLIRLSFIVYYKSSLCILETGSFTDI